MNIENLTNKRKIDILKGFRRLAGFPLDDTSIFVDYTSALEYSKTKIAYTGQIIIVLVDNNPAEAMLEFNGKTIPYMINYAKELVPLNEDAYFVRKAFNEKIQKLTEYVEQIRDELIEYIDTYHYIRLSELTLLASTETSNASIALTFTYGDDTTEVHTIELDSEFFQINPETKKVTFSAQMLHNLERLTQAEIDIDRLEVNLGLEIQRAKSEEARIEGRLDDEINRATSEEERIETKLDAEIERSITRDDLLDSKIKDNREHIDAIEAHNIVQDNLIAKRLKYSETYNHTPEYFQIEDDTTKRIVPTQKTVLDETRITLERPVINDIHGIKSGTYFNDSQLKQMMIDLLTPYVEPICKINSLTINSNKLYDDNIYFQKGSIIELTELNLSIRETSKPITSIELLNNSDKYSLNYTEDVNSNVNILRIFNHQVNFVLRDNTTIGLRVTDGDTSIETLKHIYFNLPIIRGTISLDNKEEEVRNIINTGTLDYSYNPTADFERIYSFTAKNKACYIAIPAQFDIAHIIDQNNFILSNNFSKETVQLNVPGIAEPVEYYLVYNNASTITDYKINFKFEV